MDRQTATEAVKERLTEYVESITDHSRKGNKKAYVCPICGSGTGRSKTGAFTIAPDGLSWKCFACDKGGDTLDLIGYVEDIGDYSAKVKRAGELFNIETGTATEYQNQAKSEQTTHTHSSIHTKENAQTNYISFYKDAHKHIKDTEYPAKRGLSDSLLERFKIGFIAEWRHPNANENAPTSPRLIIPVTQTSYLARDTRENIPDYQKQYSKQKVGEVIFLTISPLLIMQTSLFSL